MSFDAALGIVHVTFESETDITLEVARAEIAAIKRLTGGVRRPVLCDFANVRSTSMPARIYYGGQECRSAYEVVAFLTRSTMTMAIANVFLAFHGRASRDRIRLFTSETEALAWLGAFAPPRAEAPQNEARR